MEVLGTVSSFVQVVVILADKFLKERRDNKHTANVEQLKQFLSRFQSFIRDQEARHQETNVARDLVNSVLDVTAKIEDALDEFTFSSLPHWHSTKIGQNVSNIKHHITDKFPAMTLASQTAKIKKDIDQQKLHERTLVSDTVGGTSSQRRLENASSRKFLVEDPIVGFTCRRKELVTQLLSPDEERAIIQVVGPGGSGKTFLVKNVIRDPKVKSHFQCLAWISVMSLPDRAALVGDLLKQTCSERDRNIRDRAGNNEQILRDHLEDKRYLFVLDNVWKRQDYADIVNDLLPANNSGSRIIITSRNSGLADKPKFTHKLDGLLKKEAWDLFCHRVFGNQLPNSCPQVLRAVSEEIVNRCEGMPLAIVSVGSLLAKEQFLESTWQKFNERLGSELRRNSNLQISGRILQPSFMDLPHKFRSCFLYFSLFPENEDISRGRLIRSWMAEGFLSETDSGSPEEYADSYLNELIERSMVRVSEWEIIGRVRSCKLLRLHHELVVPLSESGNFVTVVSQRYEKQRIEFKARRLSVQSDNFVQKLSGINDLSHVRTLFVFGKVDALPTSSSFRRRLRKAKEIVWSDELTELFKKFKLLKVLDLQGVPLAKLPENVGALRLLKCLNLRYTNLESVPSSVENLWLLETLDLKYTLVKVLPKWVIRLRNLRHLVASCRATEGKTVQEGVAVTSESIGDLSSLQKLSLIRANYRRFRFSHLENLVQLKKLGIVDLETECGIELCRAIEKMESLLKLDIRSTANNYLKLDDITNPPRHIRSLSLRGLLRNLPSWIPKLSSLVKVVLKWSRSNDTVVLQALGGLPSLMELEMVEYYTGATLRLEPGTFKNLRKLHVEKFDNLTEVITDSKALIMLEHLTICKCEKLRPLPRSYRLQQLKELVIYEMSPDFINDIHCRIHEGELVDHVQNISSGEEIRSRRYVS